MDYDQRARDAYIAGARETLIALIPFLRAAEARAVQEWIDVDFAAWESGEPPAAA